MKHYRPSSWIIFLSLLTIQDGARGAPSERNINVWTNKPGNITVLEHTTACLNWTHSIKGNVHIQWEHINRNGTKKQILSYARGHVANSTMARRDLRANYLIMPGSATMTLGDVTPFDEGIYIVKVASSVGMETADRVDTSMATLRVISASNVQITVTINGEVFTLSVAEHGRNITLPEGNVVFIESPRVIVEVADFVPMPISIAVDTLVQEQKSNRERDDGPRGCMQCRKVHFSWSQAITVKIMFDIQNLETVSITRHIRNQVPWQTFPGTTLVLAQTDAILNWTYAISHPVNILWYYRKSLTDQKQLILSCIDDQVAVPKYMQGHKEYLVHDILRSAAIKIFDVAEGDAGFYDVLLVDPSHSTQNTSDVAELLVVDGTTLAFSVLIDTTRTLLSVFNNGTNITLPELTLEVPSQHSIEVDIVDYAPNAKFITISNDVYHVMETCRYNRTCKRYPKFEREVNERLATKMTISIGFDIQNLDIIELHYTLRLISSLPQIGEDSATVEKKYWDHGRLFITICAGVLFVTVVALLIWNHKKWKLLHTRSNKEEKVQKWKLLHTRSNKEEKVQNVSTAEKLPFALPKYLNETPFKYHVYIVRSSSQHDNELKKLEHALSSAGLTAQKDETPNHTESVTGIDHSMRIVILFTKDCMNSRHFRRTIPVIKEKAMSISPDMVAVARAQEITEDDMYEFGLENFFSVEFSQENQRLLLDRIQAEVFRSPGIRPNLGLAMAINYYHGYLSIVLPDLRQRLTTPELLGNAAVTTRHEDSHLAGNEDYETVMSYKLFIIIPENLRFEENELNSVEYRKVPFEISRAGQKRDYSTHVHEITNKEKRKVYRFVYDFPSILVNILEMSSSDEALGKEKRSQEIRQFYLHLTSLIQNNAQCCGNCSFLFYWREKPIMSLSEMLCERIEYEVDIERKTNNRATDGCELEKQGDSIKSDDKRSEDDETEIAYLMKKETSF